MVSAMIPGEVARMIISHVSPEYDSLFDLEAPDIPVASDVLKTIAAWSATCHVFSTVARPLLFNQILITSETRGTRLLDLIEADQDIAKWATRVIIRTHVEGNERSDEMEVLSRWLGGSSGFKLISYLSHAKLLQVEYMWDFEHMDDPVTQAWKNLSCLQHITHLNIVAGHLPSLQYLFNLVSTVYLQLESFSFDSVRYVNMETPFSDHTETAVLPSLRRIQQCGYHTSTAFLLLQKLFCPNLTHITMRPSELDDKDYHYGIRPLNMYAQGLLNSAHTLRYLTIIGNWGPRALNLKSNSQLRCIIVEEIATSYRYRTWLADTLSSLPLPIQLERLEISGHLDNLNRDFWTALDNVLSKSQFSCVSGMRNLDLINTNVRDSSLAPQNMSSVLPHTEHLRWFKVVYTANLTIQSHSPI
jgi:hypothetical protein